MKTVIIFQKTVIAILKLLTSTCTNDLVVNAKQVNYLEMFLIAFAVELKNNINNYDVNLLLLTRKN